MLKIDKNKDWLEQTAAHHPDKNALIFEEESFTFQQTLNKVIETEFHLGAIHLKRGDRVAVCGENNPEFIFLIFAVWRKGAVPIIINPKLSISEIEQLLAETKPAFFFIHKSQKKLYDELEFTGKIFISFLFRQLQKRRKSSI